MTLRFESLRNRESLFKLIDLNLISKETSRAEHEYMNKHPIKVLATAVFVVIKNACVTYLFQILLFTDPKNLSYGKRTLSSRINCTTKEISLINSFLIPAIRLVCV